MKYLLGIDVGTTGTKSVLFAQTGEQVASHYYGYPLINQRADWVEQYAEDWWKGVVATVQEVIRLVDDKKDIYALSLSTQGGSLVVLNEDYQPMMPAISWMDRRAGRLELDQLIKDKPEDYYYFNTGWKLTNSFNLVQIKWLQNHKPSLFRKAAKFLSTSDYLNYKLTGLFVTDYTSAGITNMENLKRRSWDRCIFDDLGIKSDQLSQLSPSCMIIGRLNEQAALELNLSPDTIVINGGMDQYCGAVGASAVREGDLMLATGTSWVMLGTLSKLYFDQESYLSPCPHILPQKYGIMATVPTAGVSMEWFRQTYMQGTGTEKISYNAINQLASVISPGADGLLFYPHFSGATCPSWKVNNRAGFIGVHLGHKIGHFARAIMEGVAFDASRVIEAMQQCGDETKQIKMIGGAAKSDLWSQVVSDITGMCVERPVLTDAPCAGAAMIAGVGSGLIGSFEEAQQLFCKFKDPIYPNEKNHAQYKQIKERYLEGFHCLTHFYESRD
ncbi:MAG: FGGY family carbohydrate kinase [Clostridia bacterium]